MEQKQYKAIKDFKLGSEELFVDIYKDDRFLLVDEKKDKDIIAVKLINYYNDEFVLEKKYFEKLFTPIDESVENTWELTVIKGD